MKKEQAPLQQMSVLAEHITTTPRIELIWDRKKGHISDTTSQRLPRDHHLLILKGLPGSGKSTWAAQLQAIAAKSGQRLYKIINKDRLRAMLDSSRFSSKNEKLILKTRNRLLVDSLKRDYNVIIDDTNLHPKHEAALITITRKLFPKISVIVVDFTEVPLNICIENDIQRKNLPSEYVGKKVILGMYHKYVRKPFQPLTQDKSLSNAIIVDIDGTLANCDHRSPYDTEKCLEDKVITPVDLVVMGIQALRINVMLISGREDSYRTLTESWLEKHDIDFKRLYMRKAGDTRADWIVKRELFYNHIKNKYNVLFVIDDRPQVRQMWITQGLFVFNVYQDLYQAEF